MADHTQDTRIQTTQLQQELPEQMQAKSSPAEFDTYQTSLTGRYCSTAMSHLFSQRSRYSTWRKLWLYLAQSEKDLGIESITLEALEEMRTHVQVTDFDFETARTEEKRRRHDVMGHIYAYGIVAPSASGIIHYGATSCFVTDNTELILMRDALQIILLRLSKVMRNLSIFALKWKAEPTLAYTHLQPAQLITVGKRAAQWIQDLMFDLQSIEHVRKGLRFRGAQGTTGTQASFLEIFGGDASKCDRLNELLCQKAGFTACYDVSAQTYTRKVDLELVNAVAGLGATAQKICGDIRHLAAWKEVEEPFESTQIGSSAMWLERTLDDSAIRRIDIPEMFLLADAILLGLDNVTDGLVVYPKRIQSRVQEELPFMITESIIMKLVAHGESRQEAHEQIRILSQEAANTVKNEVRVIFRITNLPFLTF
ncbi:MAG: adenylosuccinase ade13 [Alectoria sarmentosa]|nr:MAG: adenylosuccinase ade13 [Alectoria sarmentosa]